MTHYFWGAGYDKSRRNETETDSNRCKRAKKNCFGIQVTLSNINPTCSIFSFCLLCPAFHFTKTQQNFFAQKWRNKQ